MITQLRTLHLGYVIALVILLILALVAGPAVTDSRLPSIITGGIGLGTLGGILAIRRRPPSFANAEPVLAIRTMAFLNVAFSMIPALVGLVAAFLGGGVGVYVLGFVISVGLLLATIPTRRSVSRLAEAAGASGDDTWAALLQ